MKKIRLKGLDEVIYTDTCSNGLEIYVWQNKKVNTCKGAYVVKVGAEDICFSISSKKITVPRGTHHYLEHIMCKWIDGSSLLDIFNKQGCYANAATYPDKTVYEFVGSQNLKENLELLLYAVSHPNFNEEYFEKERGPILEEARMRADDVGRISLYGINKCLFHNYPNHVSGLGTLEDIKNITLDNLKTVFETFYHPKNSFLVVTGNVDPEEVISIVKETQESKSFPDYLNPICEKYKEPRKVLVKQETQYANIETPRLYLSVKIPRKKFEIDDILLLSIAGVVLNSNFGLTSLLREELMEKNLIVSLGTGAFLVRDYLVLQITTKTKCPLEVLPYLKEKLSNLEILWSEIHRKIKSEIANLVLSYEDPEIVCDMLIYCLVKYGKIIEDEKNILESINEKLVLQVFNNISMKHMNTFFLYPLKDQKKDD